MCLTGRCSMCRHEVSDQWMRSRRAETSAPPPYGRCFLMGMIAGALLVAAMDFGDVWVCVGSCGDSATRAAVVGVVQ